MKPDLSYGFRIVEISFFRDANLSSRLIAALVAIAGSTICGCAHIIPYRTQEAPSAFVDCTPQYSPGSDRDDQLGHVDSRCDKLITEHSVGNRASGEGAYDLHFVEFDDQGLPFPATVESGDASRQLSLFLDSVRNPQSSEFNFNDPDGIDTLSDSMIGRTDAMQSLSIVVFVHGWKHTAQSTDQNVRWFRSLLADLSNIEKKSVCNRKVIGLYVGWHGMGTRFDSSTLGGSIVESTTFWSRKNAASRVANGSIRELFGRLRAIQEARNVEWNKRVKDSIDEPDSDRIVESSHCEKMMRVTIVGHSFGGLIVYSALAPSLIRDITDLKESIRRRRDSQLDHDPLFNREGDVVVAINPAVEAATFAPLYRAAFDETSDSERVMSYHSPMFVSVTSINDKATGVAFPLARYASTLFYRYPKGADRERTASLKTIGHDQDYINYRLSHDVRKIKGLGAPAPLPPPTNDDEWINNKFVLDNTGDPLAWGDLDAFVQKIRESGGDANQAGIYPRVMYASMMMEASGVFRDALILTPANKSVNVNIPIWNVSTSRPVLNDHSDLLNVKLMNFLEAIYQEGTRPEIANNFGGPVIANNLDRPVQSADSPTKDDLD